MKLVYSLQEQRLLSVKRNINMKLVYSGVCVCVYICACVRMCLLSVCFSVLIYMHVSVCVCVWCCADERLIIMGVQG